MPGTARRSRVDRLAQPPQRGWVASIFKRPHALIGRVQHRRQISRMHRIHPHPVRSVPASRRLRIKPHRAFRCRVPRMPLRAAHEPHDRGNIHDRAAARLHHLGRRQFGSQKNSGRVDIQQLLPPGQIVMIADSAAAYAGVVHQYIQAAEFPYRFSNDILPIGFRRHIATNEPGPRLSGADIGGDSLAFADHVGDHDQRRTHHARTIRPRILHMLLRSTADDGDFIFQTHSTSPVSASMGRSSLCAAPSCASSTARCRRAPQPVVDRPPEPQFRHFHHRDSTQSTTLQITRHPAQRMPFEKPRRRLDRIGAFTQLKNHAGARAGWSRNASNASSPCSRNRVHTHRQRWCVMRRQLAGRSQNGCERPAAICPTRSAQ